MAGAGPQQHADRILSVVRGLENRPAATIGADPRIASSWQRCLVTYKLDPGRGGPPRTLTRSELKDFVGPMDELIHLAMPEIETLYRTVRGAGYCVNLADSNAVMVASRIPPSDEALFRQWKLYTGSMFAENVEGTNGIGTCLAEGRPVSVHRGDHFRRHWMTMSCKVAPIFDHDGALAGALNITSCSTAFDRPSDDLALAVTVEAARRIQERIFRARFSSAFILSLHGGEADGGFLAIDADRRIVGACRTARLGLGLTGAAIATGTALDDVLTMERGFDLMPAPPAPVRARRPDGRDLGLARVSPPATAPAGSARAKAPGRPAADVRSDMLMRLAGADPGLVKAVRRLTALADEDLPVLLSGETGTGKDLFARTLHDSGSRAGRRFVAFNCAALPESLIDSELFGYEPGAFTGARRDGARGLIAQADGGTLFLDEIGDMPLALQTRLLRVLENREVLPLGAGRPLKVDIRLVSATHQDLAQLVHAGRFRADLYYRLRGLQVTLPPLRARADKAALIAALIAAEAPGLRASPSAEAALMAYGWPGNIRQLRHVLRLAAATAEAGLITPDDLDLPTLPPEPCAPSLAAAERAAIDEALRCHAGSVPEAAGALGISRATLYRKLRRHRGRA
ncbi:sigma-54-dependent Fis family transcriptional regulator [Phreatobacter sp. AB_2022a]|uniref:sigma-54-dependent Fis family transcriptional regulator n=1 Tax=Phreatobacter sp. AB_2022a TaxID=3003134 RepID=UPI002287150F|nr:sigma-54-dependent Fis family transcriptional regulator [Phreatobacter sp. AB_2022a]MCZ0737699.1 sigma-54-dependent Fis family transcriptional regulator [Phreatobacter sp. AB_2022a]